MGRLIRWRGERMRGATNNGHAIRKKGVAQATPFSFKINQLDIYPLPKKTYYWSFALVWAK